MESARLFGDTKRRHVGLSHRLQPRDLDGILAITAGQVLFHEGSRLDFVFEILCGTLKTSKVSEDGRQLIFGFPTAGDIIGVAGFNEYTETVETVTPARLLPIPRAKFFKELTEGTRATEKFLCWFNQYEDRRRDHVTLLSMHRPASRVAGFLLQIARTQSPGKLKDAVQIHLPMTQRDISHYLAVAPETYSRVMRQFRESEIVGEKKSLGGGHNVEIAHLGRLEKIANGGEI